MEQKERESENIELAWLISRRFAFTLRITML